MSNRDISRRDLVRMLGLSAGALALGSYGCAKYVEGITPGARTHATTNFPYQEEVLNLNGIKLYHQVLDGKEDNGLVHLFYREVRSVEDDIIGENGEIAGVQLGSVERNAEGEYGAYVLTGMKENGTLITRARLTQALENADLRETFKEEGLVINKRNYNDAIRRLGGLILPGDDTGYFVLQGRQEYVEKEIASREAGKPSPEHLPIIWVPFDGTSRLRTNRETGRSGFINDEGLRFLIFMTQARIAELVANPEEIQIESAYAADQVE